MRLRAALRKPANVRRALITSAIVGPILTLINQTPAVIALLSGQGIAPITALRISLTFVVPLVVSLLSAALADSRR